MRKLCWLLILMACLPASANDRSIDGVGGTVVPRGGKDAYVRMVREKVLMDVYRTTYTMHATFVFHNDGPSHDVLMGFPEEGGGAAWHYQQSRFLEFTTDADGVPLHAERLPIPRRGDDTRREDSNGEAIPQAWEDGGYITYWVKTVHFPAARTVTVHVFYRSRLGNSTAGNYVQYPFTAQNWKGQVDDSRLEIHFHVPGVKVVARDADLYVLGDRAYFHRRHWNGQAEVGLRFLLP